MFGVVVVALEREREQLQSFCLGSDCVLVVLELHDVHNVIVVHGLEGLLLLQASVVASPVHSHVATILSNNDVVFVSLHYRVDVLLLSACVLSDDCKVALPGQVDLPFTSFSYILCSEEALVSCLQRRKIVRFKGRLQHCLVLPV